MPQMSVWMIVASIIAVLVFLLIGFVLGVMYRKKVSEREIASAEDEAKRIINEGIKAAENKKREALLEAKEEIHRTRTECDREAGSEEREEARRHHREDRCRRSGQVVQGDLPAPDAVREGRQGQRRAARRRRRQGARHPRHRQGLRPF